MIPGIGYLPVDKTDHADYTVIGSDRKKLNEYENYIAVKRC